MDTPTPPDGQLADKVISTLNTTAWRLTMLALQAILLAVLCLACWQGKNMLNAAISKHPDVSETKTGLAEVRIVAAAAAAQAAANTATQTRIFDALKEIHGDAESAKIASAASAEHMAGIEKQLDRVIAKQDSDEASRER